MLSWQVQGCGAPEMSLKLEDLPDPEPGDDEVVVTVHCAGVNFPDLLLCEGKYHHKPNMPFGLGMEASGTVLNVGSKVKRIRKGARVLIAPMSYGCFSEICVAPEWAVFPLGENVSWQTGAALFMTYQTAWIGLHRRARLKAGESVVVSGASGGVGSAAIEVARCAGATTIAVVSSKKKAEFALRHGSDYTVVMGEEDIVEKVRNLTGGHGADVVFDPVGGSVFREGVRCLAVEGRYLVVGFASGETPSIGINYLLIKNVDIVGFRLQPFREDPGYIGMVHGELMHLLGNNSITPTIFAEYKFSDVPAAVAQLRERSVMGKVVVNVS